MNVRSGLFAMPAFDELSRASASKWAWRRKGQAMMRLLPQSLFCQCKRSLELTPTCVVGRRPEQVVGCLRRTRLVEG